MANLLLVLVCLVAGALARMSGRLPASTPEVLTRVVIDLALPALTLVTLQKLSLGPGGLTELGAALATPVLIFAVAWLLLGLAGRVLGWSRKVTACLLLTAGLANTSFVGFPLIEALYGPAGLARAILVDQGQFLVLATAGIVTAGWGRGEARPSVTALLRRLIAFPPFVAFVLAVALRGTTFPPFLTALLEKLAQLVVPLALLAVGWQLRVDMRGLRKHARPLGLGLVVRLFVAPLIVMLVFRRVLGMSGLVADVAITEAAMAPMITGAILAMESELEPRLATLMVGVGVPLSLVTVPAWAWVLGLP
ncbi:MAG: AEC family transporter [Myxococcales bacterium]|nr:AEC family transporter [Myxococcales bacterium]